MKITPAMAKDAEKSGGKVETIRKARKPKPPAVAAKPKPIPAPTDHTADLKALRAEIAELRGLLGQSEKSATQREQELSAIITALAQEKPVRVKPVRDLDPQSKTYLLVQYYDFIPVSYKRLDS